MVIISSRYGITTSDIVLATGIGTADISDANMLTLIENAEYEVDRLTGTKFVPTRVIEHKFIDFSSTPPFTMLNKTPVTRVVNIQAGGTAGSWIDPSKTYLVPGSGKLYLRDDAEQSQFSSNEDGNVVDYYYARMEEDVNYETTLSAATGTGSSVVVTVGSSGYFSAGDYVKFEGPTEGLPEVTKVLTVGNGTFNCAMSWQHQTGSRVVKMVPPRSAKELVKSVAAIMAGLNVVGLSYNYATSYSFPEHSVTKGSRLAHLEKVIAQHTQRRDELLKAFRPQTAIY